MSSLRAVLTLALMAVMAVMANVGEAAFTYQVDRTIGTATLTGTVDIAQGNYAVTNSNPFSSVDLVLEINANTFNVNIVDTSLIFGTGVFNIEATATELIFNPIGDGGNPADLIFRNGLNDRYIIGSNGAPSFERAITSAGNSTITRPVFPLVWATRVVPEPASMALFGLGMVGAVAIARRRRNA